MAALALLVQGPPPRGRAAVAVGGGEHHRNSDRIEQEGHAMHAVTVAGFQATSLVLRPGSQGDDNPYQ